MWMIYARLFNWEYVTIKNSATEKIIRVKIAPNGERVFQPYSFQVHILPKALPLFGEVIGGWLVVPLTLGVTLREGEQ